MRSFVPDRPAQIPLIVAYTTIVRGKDDGTGVGLVEVYNPQ